MIRTSRPTSRGCKPDAGLVHHEQRIHKRRAEAGREIDALNFTAAQSPGRAIQGQITDADFAEIIQTRANLAAQHFGGFILRRDFEVLQKPSRIVDRQALKIWKR